MERFPGVKLVALLTTTGLVAAGWIADHKMLAIAGIVAFGVVRLTDVVRQVRAAMYYRRGEDEKWQLPETRVRKAASYLDGTITIAGLAAPFVATHHKAAESGFFLWIIAVADWVLSGIIAHSVAGIPLRMTYGGWKVDRGRARRHRHR